MRSHSCVWALIVAVLWLALASREVNGETRIEVDENGDEYELKRFYIQGRQLSGQGSKSQCVVTRRKRASRSMSAPSISVSSQQLSLSAATEPLKLQQEQDSNKRRYVALAAVQLQQPEDEDDEDDDEEDDEDDGDEQQLEIEEAFLVDAVQQKQFPGQSQSSFVAFTQKVPGGVSVVANAATHANVVGDAGIVVVESQEPPKVNPNTHAVFELKPLNQQAYYQPGAPLLGGDAAAEEEDEDEEDNIDSDGFYYQGLGPYDEYEHFITEESPVSTSAIWSTDGDDEDVQPVVNPAKRPVNENKKKRKQQPQMQQQKQKRRNQQSVSVSSVDQTPQKPIGNSSSSSSSSSSSGSSAPVKRRKTKPKQKKKRKSRPNSVGNRRRRPSSSSSASYSYGSMGGYKRRRPQLTEAQRRRRQQQKRRRQQLQRQRRRRNKIRQQNGYRQQYFGDEPIVNCIYINKDPVTTTTTTTPRPFWNLLGRSAAQQPQPAEQSPRRNGEFGNRKRTNLKFTA
ncbi:stress response protein nst1 [Drosophila navojoa]|uniref:stress response protein nst1 n=1 Tax=Drosophila navojoa TaxID=7232 RepID=UPI0011BF91E5|nr:stress response protein nst1 [Drosophila navojoa]